MTVGSHRPNTKTRRVRRRIGGIALAMPAVIIAGLLMLPGASTAGEGEPVVYDSRAGIVPPGGSLTTLDGPLNADDPFAVALKNISTQPLFVTIEEEPCDGTQEADPLCSEPRVGGVAGDFIFEPSGTETTAAATATTTTSNPPVVVARLYYDVSLLRGVEGVRIFWQKTPGGEVRRLPRCDDDKKVECWVKEQKSNGDQIIRIKLRQDPRFTRG